MSETIDEHMEDLFTRKNERYHDLVSKELDGSLVPEERREMERLNDWLDGYDAATEVLPDERRTLLAALAAAEARAEAAEKERDDLNAQATRALAEAGMPPPDGGYVGRGQLLWADIGRLAYLKDELKKDVSRAASLCRVTERERDDCMRRLEYHRERGAGAESELAALRARVEALEEKGRALVYAGEQWQKHTICTCDYCCAVYTALAALRSALEAPE